MPLLNYTTKVATEKTLGEISRLLVSAKVSQIRTEYDPHGQPCALAFLLPIEGGQLPFRLPARVDKIEKLMHRDRVPTRYRNREQAARVAWRIVKSWLEAQLALIRAEQAEFAEVFLPYAQQSNGTTVYEHMKAQPRFSGLALPMEAAPR
jgi:RecB family exonuclease